MKRMHGPVGSRGFSLVELMVALVLGLLVVGSALAVFLSNRQTYAATESLGRTQENSRLAFELISRELREAGTTPCGNTRATVGTVLNGAGANWFDWSDAVIGYTEAQALPGVPFGTARGNRIAGTDALEIHGAASGGRKARSHDAAGATFEMMDVDHGLIASDIVVVCDYQRATIFQISSVAGEDIGYQADVGVPGNDSITLGACMEAECTPGFYTYAPSMIISRLGASRWYIGANGRGGNSLFLQTLRNVGGVSQSSVEEIAEGVNDLQLSYLVNTNNQYYVDRVVVPGDEYLPAVAAAQRPLVLALRLDMTFVGPDQVEGDDIERRLTNTVALRNQNL